MLKDGHRYCDRCGALLTKDNNKCGFEICDRCNDILEKSTKKRMTNEQHIENLKKLLEQEPCEDAISRADAEALFRNARSKLNPSDYKTADEFNTRVLILLNAEQFIHLLPPVNPQPKTGHWIAEENEEMETIGYYCSECDLPMETENQTRFCPNCGAKMEVSDGTEI